MQCHWPPRPQPACPGLTRSLSLRLSHRDGEPEAQAQAEPPPGPPPRHSDRLRHHDCGKPRSQFKLNSEPRARAGSEPRARRPGRGQSGQRTQTAAASGKSR